MEILVIQKWWMPLQLLQGNKVKEECRRDSFTHLKWHLLRLLCRSLILRLKELVSSEQLKFQCSHRLRLSNQVSLPQVWWGTLLLSSSSQTRLQHPSMKSIRWSSRIREGRARRDKPRLSRSKPLHLKEEKAMVMKVSTLLHKPRRRQRSIWVSSLSRTSLFTDHRLPKEIPLGMFLRVQCQLI